MWLLRLPYEVSLLLLPEAFVEVRAAVFYRKRERGGTCKMEKVMGFLGAGFFFCLFLIFKSSINKHTW